MELLLKSTKSYSNIVNHHLGGILIASNPTICGIMVPAPNSHCTSVVCIRLKKPPCSKADSDSMTSCAPLSSLIRASTSRRCPTTASIWISGTRLHATHPNPPDLSPATHEINMPKGTNSSETMELICRIGGAQKTFELENNDLCDNYRRITNVHCEPSDRNEIKPTLSGTCKRKPHLKGPQYA
jgi:hypothetical protein